MYEIGSRIKEARTNRRLTQKQLAVLINKSVSAISGYENGAQTPPMDVLISIGQVLNVPITYLYGYNEGKSYSTTGLSTKQKNAIDLIFIEFANPTTAEDGECLSPQQIEIIQRLIRSFQKE